MPLLQTVTRGKAEPQGSTVVTVTGYSCGAGGGELLRAKSTITSLLAVKSFGVIGCFSIASLFLKKGKTVRDRGSLIVRYFVL